MSTTGNTLERYRLRTNGIEQVKAALFAEAQLRNGRSFEDWSAAEAQAVWAAGRDFAQQHGFRVPLLEEVIRVERLACGHSDYASQWARYVLDLAMQDPQATA